MQGRCAGQEINDNRLVFEAGANQQGGVRFAIELRADLSREVPANVQKLVGVGEAGGRDGRNSRRVVMPCASSCGPSRRMAV